MYIENELQRCCIHNWKKGEFSSKIVFGTHICIYEKI